MPGRPRLTGAQVDALAHLALCARPVEASSLRRTCRSSTLRLLVVKGLAEYARDSSLHPRYQISALGRAIFANYRPAGRCCSPPSAAAAAADGAG